jgi:hypothetical protein
MNDLGRQMAEFYQGLIEGGMPESRSFDIVKAYVLSMASLAQITGGGGEVSE